MKHDFDEYKIDNFTLEELPEYFRRCAVGGFIISALTASIILTLLTFSLYFNEILTSSILIICAVLIAFIITGPYSYISYKRYRMYLQNRTQKPSDEETDDEVRAAQYFGLGLSVLVSVCAVAALYSINL